MGSIFTPGTEVAADRTDDRKVDMVAEPPPEGKHQVQNVAARESPAAHPPQ